MISEFKGDLIISKNNYRPTIEYRGLSTDPKPTDAINGASYIEIDTGKVYLFDATGAEWYEM